MPSLNGIEEKTLAEIREKSQPVAIFLKNGIKLTGKIINATEDVIFLDEPVCQMIYKTCISTIAFI